jgi:hypothetical protein
MEFRHLGRSGLKVSEIAYGNWITHGSQVDEDAARACVAAALDEDHARIRRPGQAGQSLVHRSVGVAG